MRVDEVRHSGLWEITHHYELDHAGHLSSGIRAGDQTTVSPDTTHEGFVPANEHW